MRFITTSLRIAICISQSVIECKRVQRIMLGRLLLWAREMGALFVDVIWVLSQIANSGCFDLRLECGVHAGEDFLCFCELEPFKLWVRFFCCVSKLEAGSGAQKMLSS